MKGKRPSGRFFFSAIPYSRRRGFYAWGMSKDTTSPSVRLTGAKLSMVLFHIGWTSENAAAEKCRMHRTQLRRCLEGRSALDEARSAWLLRLRDAHLENPCPVRPKNDAILRELESVKRADEEGRGAAA